MTTTESDRRARRPRIAGSRTAIAITAVIVTAVVVAGGLATALPGRNSVTRDDIAKGAVGIRQIAVDAVASDEIVDDSVTSDDIADDSLTGDDIADGTLTGDDLSPSFMRWVRVDSNGAATPAVLNSSAGIASVSRLAAGAYLVVFDESIVNCAWIATKHDEDAGGVSSGYVAVERNSSGNEFTLRVRHFNAAGTQADMDASDGFSLQVLC